MKGTRLPSQADLAAEYSVALMTVRQAIQQLERDGLVASEHGRGTFVHDRRSSVMLRTAHQVFRSAIADAPVAISTLDPAGNVRSWNTAAEVMYGWREEEVLGHIPPVIPVEDLEEARTNMTRVLAGERLTDLEARRVRRDGSIIVCSLSMSPLFDADGYVNGVITTARDISEHRHADEVRARMAAIVSSSADAIIAKTLDGIITDWNPAAEALYGYTAQEAVGGPIAIIQPEGAGEEMAHIIDLIRFGQHVGPYDTRGRRKDGKLIDISLTVSPILDKDGRIIGASSIAREVTIRKATTTRLYEQEEARHITAETRALREERDRLATIVESSGDGMFTRTLDGIVTSWNHGATCMSGYSADEMIGRHFSTFAPPDIVQSATEAVLGGKPVARKDVACTRKDGSRIWVSAMIAPIFDADGTITGVSCVMRDVTARREAEEQARFQATLLGVVGQAVIATTIDGDIIYWNRAAGQLYGWDADEVLGRNITDILVTPRSPQEERGFIRSRCLRGSEQSEWSIRRRDGTQVPVLVDSVPLEDENGTPIGLIGVSTDISRRKRAEEALRESEKRYRTVVEMSVEGIAVTDMSGRITFANDQLAHMLGLDSRQDLIGMPGSDFIAQDDLELVRSEFRSFVEEGITTDARCRALRADGTLLPVQVSGRLVYDEEGMPAGTTFFVRDISTQLEYEAQLQRLALYDTLTGIPNRTLLMNRLEHGLTFGPFEGGASRVALLLLDLDHFKEINDTYGHQFGDRVLQEIARRFGGVLRPLDTLARLGGDEYAVLLPKVDLFDAIQTATRLTAALESPIELDGQQIHVGTSIGIVISPDHGDTAEVLLRRADIAMYLAKRSNCGYAVYAPEQDEHTPLRLVLINQLRKAIERDQLVLHFQPKLRLDSGMIEGVEALVRWQHPEHGLIPPDQFISLAEHSGLIRPLTAWVTRKALEQCRRWQDMGYDFGIAVNLSTRSLHDPDLPAMIAHALAESGVRASQLTVEITESVIMTEPDRAMEILLQLKGLGIRLSIDDFGMGYSSLSYLRQIKADELKIHKSFVLDLDVNRDEGFIVRAVIELGHNLGLDVVAEGVENQHILDILGGLHCNWAQGYHLSRPQPGERLTEWMRDQPHIRPMGPRIVVVGEDLHTRDQQAEPFDEPEESVRTGA